MNRKRIYLLLLTLLLTNTLSAQVSIPGLSGLELNEADSSYSISINEEFTFQEVQIKPIGSGLTLFYDVNQSTFSIWGEGEAITGSGTLKVSLGTSSTDPGIRFTTSDIDLFSATVNSEFRFEGLLFTPTSLGLSYNKSGSKYGITGSATLKLFGKDVDLGFNGDGIVIANGELEEFNAEMSTEFTVDGLTISPQSVTSTYNHSSKEIEFSGNVKVTLDGNEVDATFGEESGGTFTKPGLVLGDGKLKLFEISITDDVKLSGIDLKNQGLTIIYSESKFELYGNASIEVEGTSIFLVVGTEENPGVIIEDGSLQDIDLKVSTSSDHKFKFGGLEIKSTSLEFEYDASINQYIIFGGATLDVEGNPFSIQIGDVNSPGIKIRNNVLEAFGASVTGSFHLKDVEFESNGLEFTYANWHEVYSFSGGAKLKIENEFVEVDFVTSSGHSGLLIEEGEINRIELAVTSELKISGAELKTKSLGFAYNTSSDEFQMFGEADFIIEENEKIEVKVGTEQEPGLIMKKGELISLDMTVTSDFKAKELEFKTKNLEIEWFKNVKKFTITGEADLEFEDDTFDVVMEKNKGGIEIEDGKITSLDIKINSDIKLGSLELITKDLTLEYNGLTEEISLIGIAEIKEVFEVKVEFGMPNSQTPGLVVDFSGSKPKFKIDDLTVEVDHLNLGTIDLKMLKLEFNSSGLKEADVAVVFPGGNEFGGDLVFTGDPMKLEKISIDYRADNLAEGIEIFEGVQVAYMMAEVTNIDKPHDLKVHGAVQVYVGDGLSFDGISLAMIESGQVITIDKNELKLSSFLNLGAEREGDSNNWRNYFGTSYTEFAVNFPRKRVSTSVSTLLPASFSLIEIDASVLLSPTNFALWAYASFYVPKQIPLAGGKKLFNADGAIHYYFNSSEGGYIAGWTKFLGQTVGARYNFWDKKTHSIGSGGVSDIINDYRWAENHKTLATHDGEENISVHTFEIKEDGVNYALIQADWHKTIDSVFVEVIGPEGFYDVSHWDIVSQNDVNTLPDVEIREGINYVLNDSLGYFQINTPSLIREQEARRPSMVKGRYQVAFYYPDMRPDTLSLAVHQVWQDPEIQMDVTHNEANKYDIDLNFWSALPDTTEIMILVSDTPDHEDSKVIANIFPENFDADNYGSYSFEYSPDFSPINDTLYFSTQIYDNINPPIRTELSPPHAHSHDISGTLQFPAEYDSLKSGVRLFVDVNDNGSFDIESTGGLEPFGISLEDGTYHIHESDQGTFPLRAVLPRGFRIKGTENRSSAVMVTFTGEPQIVNLEIETYTPN